MHLFFTSGNKLSTDLHRAFQNLSSQLSLNQRKEIAFIILCFIDHMYKLYYQLCSHVLNVAVLPDSNDEIRRHDIKVMKFILDGFLP